MKKKDVEETLRELKEEHEEKKKKLREAEEKSYIEQAERRKLEKKKRVCLWIRWWYGCVDKNINIFSLFNNCLYVILITIIFRVNILRYAIILYF